MHSALFLIGVAKLFFGVIIAAFGVFFGLRVIHRLGYLPPELASPNDWIVELAP